MSSRTSAALAAFALVLSLGLGSCKSEEPRPTATPAAAPADASADPADDAGTTDQANPRPAGTTWVWAPRLAWRVGESIQVDFRFAGAGEGRPWVGLVPDTVTGTDEPTNDDADVAYEYLPEGSREGTVAVRAVAPGRYRLRLLSSDSENGTVVAETPVLTITKWAFASEASAPAPQLTLADGDDEVALGAAVDVGYDLGGGYPQAWIGLVPATVTTRDLAENDSADVTYEWARERQGSVALQTDGIPPGIYVVRLFPCDIAYCDAVAEAGPIAVE